MSGRDLVNRAVRRISASRRGVRAVALLRNQCNLVIGYHLAPSDHAEANGELRLLDRISVRTFIDVGANIGDWTQLVLDRNPDAQGIAVEPGTAALSRLRDRLDGRVRVVEAAGGASAGRVAFFEQPDASEHSSIVLATGEPREVDVVTVDGLMRSAGWETLDLLKIDTEGYDALVLEGAAETLRDGKVKAVQFEYNETWRGAGRTLGGAIAMLEGFGYRTLAITPRGLEPYDYGRFGEFFAYSNFVAVRRDVTV